jgi:plastocyanin
MRRLSVLLVFMFAVACNKEVTDPVQPAESTVLATANNQFLPPQTSIRLGGKVTWEFQAAHSVVFDPKAGTPDDIQQSPAGSSDLRTFAVAGVFRYTCSVTGHTEFGFVTVVAP